MFIVYLHGMYQSEACHYTEEHQQSTLNVFFFPPKTHSSSYILFVQALFDESCMFSKRLFHLDQTSTALIAL